jgi:thiamine-phosphate pyrophosphorylase
MRETRLSGSEGGARFYPLSLPLSCPARREPALVPAYPTIAGWARGRETSAFILFILPILSKFSSRRIYLFAGVFMILRVKPLAQCRLYTFVDTAYLHGRDPAAVARELCRGGSDLIQLRAKDATLAETRRLAEAIAPVIAEAGVGLVINDYPDIARAVGAAFCHLGQEDFFDAGHTHVSQLALPGSSLVFGLSTHTPAQAERALAAEPAYVAIGPVYATGTKPTARPVTLDYVRWAAGQVRLPWFAIGGINLQTLDEVLVAGARRICVVSAILNAPDIAEACAQFKARLEAVA